MPSIDVHLPVPHADQLRAYHLSEDARGGDWAKNAGGRFKVGRCGRRWGKSTLGETWICEGVLDGEPTGWFAPDYKTLAEVRQEIFDLLDPIKVTSNKTDGVIRALTDGRVDFWSLENERAGRSRKYKRVVIDEAAFTNPNMMEIWERSIKPTLLDLDGEALVISNTNGVDTDNFLWRLCNQPEHGFIEFHAPSWANPLIPARRRKETDADWKIRQQAVFDDLRAREHPLVFAQEYAAEFVDWSGVAFFELSRMLDREGRPVEIPVRCDAVFAVADTATKTGSANDGTGLTYWAFAQHGGVGGTPILILLDWDLVQIEGAMLEVWLPGVIENLEGWARRCSARAGSLGVHIENKNSGEILLQQAANRNLLAHPIESRLTAMGKDERAISVSGYVYRGEVKISSEAYHKVSTFKGVTRNHLISQVTGFRVGDKDAAKRADDLFDSWCYGVALSLGNAGGF